MTRGPSWRERATCRGRLDLDFIDPADEQIDQCRAVCAECPVRELCLAEALTSGEAWGIWGGLDADERAAVAEQSGHPAPTVRPAHGTNARYAKHRCRCAACTAAHAEYERERRARLRARKRGTVPRAYVLAEPVRCGRTWAGAGQYVLALPGLPIPAEAELDEPLGAAA
ncbi:WhiB family transcriptional regulator [Amycolatopsis nalaikhensis]|uniref:Transcriptional regulator WhiB n=1 Tax=Amycolatopsis nalaikhensis TaxID=715472 RepID=A0ABY8XTV5_9PSEU|nr:WhiB family transcriptional regulator [Amycolatopsis sp. 2-2]WIV59038.1 WhiB family transcriptional regulator [Amycolatopsis sp. 2-2]